MITKITVSDRRFPLEDGAGADSIHTQPVYAYAVCELHTETGTAGIGLAFTLGQGNDLVCNAITTLSQPLIGQAMYVPEIRANAAEVRVRVE